MDSNHAAGTTLGGLAGILKGLTSASSMGFITWEIAGDTAMLAAIGGIVGWSVSEILKLIKSKLTKPNE